MVVGCRHRGPELRIDICDTGAGIPADERQRIFGEFYQLSRRAPDRSGGFGLGLAIVDRLGRLLGHRIELESSPGRGSRFSVSVPLAAQPRGAEMPAPLPAIADPARGKRVIVIDDDALVLDAMRGILQSWGCRVQTAASGDAALAGLAKDGGSPDLIISDSRLADGESGVETIERLRAAVGAPIPAFCHHRRHRARAPMRGPGRRLPSFAQASVADVVAHYIEPAAEGARHARRLFELFDGVRIGREGADTGSP